MYRSIQKLHNAPVDAVVLKAAAANAKFPLPSTVACEQQHWLVNSSLLGHNSTLHYPSHLLPMSNMQSEILLAMHRLQLALTMVEKW